MNHSSRRCRIVKQIQTRIHTCVVLRSRSATEWMHGVYTVRTDAHCYTICSGMHTDRCYTENLFIVSPHQFSWVFTSFEFGRSLSSACDYSDYYSILLSVPSVKQIDNFLLQITDRSSTISWVGQYFVFHKLSYLEEKKKKKNSIQATGWNLICQSFNLWTCLIYWPNANFVRIPKPKRRRIEISIGETWFQVIDGVWWRSRSKYI